MRLASVLVASLLLACGGGPGPAPEHAPVHRPDEGPPAARAPVPSAGPLPCDEIVEACHGVIGADERLHDCDRMAHVGDPGECRVQRARCLALCVAAAGDAGADTPDAGRSLDAPDTDS